MRGIKVEGIGTTIRNKLSTTGIDENADRISRDTIYNIGRKAKTAAPVDTGLMRSSLVTGIQPTDRGRLGSWDMVQTVPYTLVQEYEHKRRSAFIRNAVSAEKPAFKKRLADHYLKGSSYGG